MFFELQLSADVFTRVVRNRLKALSLCVDREFVDEDGKLTGVPGAPVVVDRVEIGEATSIQREQVQKSGTTSQDFAPGATQVAWIFSPTNYTSHIVPFLQVKQEVHIRLVKGTELEAKGPGPTTPFRTLTVHVVLNVALQASNQTGGGGPLTLSYSLAHIDYGILYLFLPAKQRQDIEQFVAGIQLPPTTLDLGALAAMLRRPVSGINAGIVCDTSNAFVALRVDFDVYNSPVAVTPQFFADAPENLLDGGQWAMLIDRDALIVDALARTKKALESDSKIKLVSGPHVAWDAGGPAINVQADVELVDACPFFVDDIDMNVDLHMRAELSVPTPNTVRTRYHLEGSPSDVGEEIACAVTGALLWPFIGPLFLKDEDIGAGLGAYFGGLAAGPVLTLFGILVAIETKKLSKDISDKLGDSCKKVDDENYECNETVQLIMQLTPAANSRLEVQGVSGNQRGLVFRGAVSNLRDFLMGQLEPLVTCPFKWQVLGRCTGNGRSNFRVGNEASIHVYGTPPAAMCSARILHDPENEFALMFGDGTITIVPHFKPSYVSNPYPCRVRVITNRGVRTITLAPPVAKTTREAEELEGARLAAHVSCYYWEKMFTPVEKIKWLPDPPFHHDRFVQFWQIAVRGLGPEDSIHVRSQRGAPLLTAKPSRAGVAHFALLFAADQAQPVLELELRGRREMGDEQREISLQQVLFEYRASLPVGGMVRSMRFEGGTHHQRLAIVQDDREIMWDLATPVAPALLHSLPARNEQKAPREQLVLHTGKRIGATPGPNLMRALHHILQQHDVPEVVGSPRLGGAKETLYVRSKSAARLLDITNPEEPREMHVYEQPAWFEDVAMGGKLLAKYDARLDAVDIYVAGMSKGCA